ncbi:hypothetical protein [Corynebacterium sp. CNJ-954]|uniref:hypothetical protein n=1 Tax=Corynebacterium sp. CNJ-954 TaxID=1904962 RepID=UPI0011153A72|nr:hypothetical protein [Corynebacterium sp. CNJ-954]
MAHLTSITLSTRSTPAPLRAFTAPMERAVKGVPTVVGELARWTALRLTDFPPPAPLNMPQEQRRPALLAVEVAEFLMPERALEHLDNLVLLSPESLTPAVTERRVLTGLISELIQLLQLEYDGCLVVTDLTHLAEEKDQKGARRVLIDAGFTAKDSDQSLWTLAIEPRDPAADTTTPLSVAVEHGDGGDQPRQAHIAVGMTVMYTRGELFEAARSHVSEMGFIDPAEEAEYLRDVSTNEQLALQSLFGVDILDDAHDSIAVTETSVSATDIRPLLPDG